MAERTFLLLGSGEFEPWVSPVEFEVLGGAPGDGSVVVLPTASAPDGDHVFDRWGDMATAHYGDMGAPIEVLAVRRREDALEATYAERVAHASMVFFSGGKPQHLASVMDGTPLWAAILAAVDRGVVYGGCSAGAMVASQSRTQRASRGHVGTGWLFGLGLVPNVSFGVHWNRMKMLPGMRPFVMSRLSPGSYFVGIDEQTAIVGDGTRWEVHGRGGAMVRHEGGTVTYRSGETFRTGDVEPG
jgi:cyanophycinase